MLECNLRLIVNKPTRVTATISTWIDLIFTNNKNYTINILKEGISDHKCVLYTFNLHLIKHTKSTILNKKKDYNDIDINSFKSELRSTGIIQYN